MITIDIVGAVAHVTLNRPAKRNAMTPEMLRQIAAAPAEVAGRARCILLSGAGDVFCAGFDLKLCLKDDTAMADLLRELKEAITALRQSPLPVVLCATGAAVAGGCALLAGADLVVADEACKLGYPVIRLGISPAVNAPTLRGRIGDGPSRARLLDTRLIDGVQAARIGLVHELLPTPAEARAAAAQIAADLAAKPPAAVAATKGWLNDLEDITPEQMAEALAVSLALAGGDEERSRLAALWA